MRLQSRHSSVVLAAALPLLLAACGGSDAIDQGAPAATSASGTAAVVSVMTVDGVGDVLVDGTGAALYGAEQEANGAVLCTSSCTAIWMPATVAGDLAGHRASGLEAELGSVARPDGARQLTLGGTPLYRFSEDPGPGQVSGNGLADSFDGHAFTWHVATPSGLSTSSDTSGDADGGGMYGGG